ncbi:MAG: HAD family hydrolase [Thermovirgaceae bacterium]|nr:HAD family hydrolase [Thermovirgaceae bacterium]
MRKLLVADIDGTLAHGDHIPFEVVKVCETLRSEGWDIAVATGRILASAQKHIRVVGAVSSAIVYDGARVMSSMTGEEIWGQKLPASVVEEALEMVWDSPAGIQVFGDEKVLCRKNDKMARKYFATLGVPVDDTLDRPRSVDGVYRIIIYGDPDEVQALENRITGIFKNRARSVLAGNGFLDILPPGVSKGRALEKLIGSMPEDERPIIVAAAGDHMNDLELLQFADISITMSDAQPSLLEIADIVLPPASEQGFSKILEPLEEAFAERISSGWRKGGPGGSAC